MDRTNLAEQLSKAANIKLGLRFKIIQTGKRGKMAEEDKIRALHIEVDFDDRYNAKNSTSVHL